MDLTQDPRILLSGQGVNAPSPLDITTQMMKLADLARQRDIRDLDYAAKKRQQDAADALEKALPLLAAGKPVEELAAQFPSAAGELMTRNLANQKDKRAVEKEEAEIKAKETERRIKGLTQVGNLAFVEAQSPNPMSVKKVLSAARYYGIDLPFPTSNVDDPKAASEYLKMLGDQAYDIKDREQNRLRGEHDRKMEELTSQRDAATRTNQEVSRQQEWARINQDRYSQPFEGTYNGERAMLVHDKRNNTVMPASVAMAGASAQAGSMPAGAPAMAGGGPGVVGPKAQLPTEGSRNDLRSVDEQLAVLQRGLEYVDKVPSAFSFRRGLPSLVPTDAMGRASESIAGRGDTPKEREARAYLFNVVSNVIKERAGTAQSASEQRRLNGFLPGDMDGPEQIRDKLHGFIQYLHDKRSANPAARMPGNAERAPLAPLETTPQGSRPAAAAPNSITIDGLIITPRAR